MCNECFHEHPAGQECGFTCTAILGDGLGATNQVPQDLVTLVCYCTGAEAMAALANAPVTESAAPSTDAE